MLSSTKIPWTIAKEIFQGEWIEIVDSEWEWNAPHPRWVRVRRHARDRNELLSQISHSTLTDSDLPHDLILFVAPSSGFVESNLCNISEFHTLDLKGSIV